MVARAQVEVDDVFELEFIFELFFQTLPILF